MNKYKISSLTFSIIVAILINSTLLGLLIPFLINKLKTSFLFSLLISFLLGFVIIFLFLKIFDFEPSKTIFEKIDSTFPKIISKLINILIFILVYTFLVVIFYRISTFISSQFLTESPEYIIPIILILPILYLSLFGIDTAGRMAIISMVIGFTMFILNIISLTPSIEIDNFKPLLNNNFIKVSKFSIIFSLVYLLPIFTTLIIPKDNIVDKSKFKKTLIITYIISYLCTSLIFLTTVGVLGVNIANLYIYPSYSVLKTIDVLSFLDNLENLNILILVLFMSYTCSFCFIFIRGFIDNIFKFKNKKINYFIYGFIIIAFIAMIIYALPYETLLVKIKFQFSYLLLIVSIAFIFLVLLTLVIGKIKKKIKGQ